MEHSTLGSTSTQSVGRYKKRPRSEGPVFPPPPVRGMVEEDADNDDDAATAAVDSDRRKRNKHAPAELSSKRAIGRFRQVVDVPKVQRRDPRFEESAGAFNADLFQKSYGFLNDYRDSEIVTMRDQLKNVKDADVRSEMQQALQHLLQTRAEAKRGAAVRSALSSHTREEKRKVAAGLKKPYFPKKRELREFVAVERFKELESQGDAALAKAMRKKSKKRMGQQHKHSSMPAPRRTATE